MTDTPEWIERATEIVALYGHDAAFKNALVLNVARELQSSFDQGVERERARCQALIREYFSPNKPAGDQVAAILTPTPTEGERG